MPYIDLFFNRNSKTSKHWGDLVPDCCTTTVTKYFMHDCKYTGVATKFTDVDDIRKMYKDCALFEVDPSKYEVWYPVPED